MDARAQPRRADEVQRRRAVRGQGEIQRTAAFALDEEPRARGEKGLFVREEVGQRSASAQFRIVNCTRSAGKRVTAYWIGRAAGSVFSARVTSTMAPGVVLLRIREVTTEAPGRREIARLNW